MATVRCYLALLCLLVAPQAAPAASSRPARLPLPRTWQVCDHLWLSEGRVLAQRRAPDGRLELVVASATDRWRPRPTTDPQPQWIEGFVEMPWQQPSPNGRWLLQRVSRTLQAVPVGTWLQQRPSALMPASQYRYSGAAWQAVHLGSGLTLHWPDHGGEGAWLRDSRGWVEASGRELIVHGLGGPPLRTLTLAEDGCLVGSPAPGRVLMRSGNTLREYALGDQAELVKERAADLPLGAQPVDVVMSPDGTRLAWLTVASPPVPHARRASSLRDLVKLVGNPRSGERLLQVWMTTAAGEGLTAVGRPFRAREERSPSDHRPTNPDWPSALRWLPDGKAVSYARNGSVWVLPVR